MEGDLEGMLVRINWRCDGDLTQKDRNLQDTMKLKTERATAASTLYKIWLVAREIVLLFSCLVIWFRGDLS